MSLQDQDLCSLVLTPAHGGADVLQWAGVSTGDEASVAAMLQLSEKASLWG